MLLQQSPSLVGDAAQLYLVRGSGSGTPIDTWLGSSPDGRWIAFVQQGQPVLLDTQRDESFELGAGALDTRGDLLSHAFVRSVAFSPNSSLVAYILRDGKVEWTPLPPKSPSKLRLAPGRPWRLEFSTDSASLRVWLIEQDDNGNGRLDWPVPASPTNHDCETNEDRYAAWLDYGDRARLRVFPLKGRPLSAPGKVLAEFGRGLLVREASGVLAFNQRGRARSLVDEECGGTLLHVDPGRQLALIACSAMGIRVPVLLVGPDEKQDLGLEVLASKIDHVADRAPRLVALYPGADSVLVDLENKRTLRLEPGDGVISVYESVALLLRGSSLFLFDADNGAATKIADGIAEFGQIMDRSPVAYVEPYLVDLAHRSIIDSVGGHLEAISVDGRYLVASAPATPLRHAQGPLRWLSPAAASNKEPRRRNPH